MHRRLISAAVGLTLTVVLFESAAAIPITVGAPQVIYTAKQRKQRKVDTWPDGSLGVVSNGMGGYEFYGANGGSPVKTTGTLTDPGINKKAVSITNIPKKTFNYVSGGPVYRDPGTGARVMFYHAEQQTKTVKNFYSMLGMAVSTDAAGLVFRDLGVIIRANMPSGQTEVGGGSFAVMNGYMNVYYRDWFSNGSTSELAVARAPVSDLISNALAGRGTSFSKYYNGDWTQPGLGGLSSPLEVGNPGNSWVSVSYNDYLNQMVMVSSQPEPGGGDLYLATSADGVNFSPRQAIARDPGEQFYPSLIGTGSDPTHTGQSFYVYYTDSQKGAWNRWSDAALVRRSVTIDPYVPPEPPSTKNWALVNDYRSDFQNGTPATGWTYTWNPTGKLGNSAAFTPLAWSDVINAYNTTGTATPAPNGKTTHHDDYMMLTPDGGHPGQPGYLPIVGYTIQANDGAGDYRIADSTIQKADSQTIWTEDGLQVLVYVNNTAIGTGAAVSTDGSLANFNRELGQLNVGDTIWVMIDSLKDQTYDAFTNFNFAIQKVVPDAPLMAMQLLGAGGAVPEPSSAALAFVALAGFGMWLAVRRRGAIRRVPCRVVSPSC